MKNPIKRFLQRRQDKKQLRETMRVLRMYAWLDKLFTSGVLHFDADNHRLMMEQSLAVLLMAKGADGWANAVREIYRYVHFRLTQEAWETYMHREEVKAVRTILNQGRELKRDDIERIKSARRMEIAQGDMQPPKVEGFEFFVIGPEVKEEAQAKTPAEGTAGTAGVDSAAVAQQPTGQAEAIPGGRILLVGHYDPATEQMEMATWEEVSLFLGGGE